MAYSSYIIYVDESGDHNLQKIDPNFPVFVLSFCIFEKENYIRNIVPKIQSFKFRYFGHDLVILHERDISKKLGVYSCFQNPADYGPFLEGLYGMLSEMPFTIISCCIDKRKLASTYVNPDNPYNISLQFCLERLYMFLKSLSEHNEVHIIFEGRGKKEDQDLELAFRRACDSNMTGYRFDFNPIIVPKGVNSSGLQIADLVSRPIGRHTINPSQRNRAYDVFEQKFRRSASGTVMGYGLKIFP